MAEKYPLDMLITARKIREDNAQREVSSAKIALQKLEESIEKKKKEIESYTIWCKEEEVRRFLEIQNTVLNQQEMERFKWGIAALQTKSANLEGDLIELEGKIKPAEQLIVDKSELFREARSKKDKIQEHKDIWKKEQIQEETRLEDLELEEFSGKKPANFNPTSEDEYR